MSHPHKHVQSNNSRQKYIYEKTKTKKRGRQTNLNTFLSVHTIKYLKLAISEWFECNHLITIFRFECVWNKCMSFSRPYTVVGSMSKEA